MTDDALIRLATVDDAAAISELITTLSDVFVVDRSQADRFLATITPTAIASYIEDEAFRYRVGIANDDLVGCVAIRDGSHLYHLFVAEAWQGRGLARRLWDEAREHALNAEQRADRFTVNASLNAHGLYRHFGFRDVGEVIRTDGLAFQPMELLNEPHGT